ncbi:MAG TPA: hypothetical protein VMV17_18165 [Streptosporangiaceae bacterium]|nr:hypothetical protein [Streptosporangiaceae bacterium]
MTAVIRTRSHRRSDAQLMAGLNDLLTPVPRARLAGADWRWRYEIALVMGAAVTVTTLLLAAGVTWTVIATSALLGLLGPPWADTQVAFLWRVVTPHRLRSGFAQARIQSRRGRLPLILRTTSEPFGERVRVWCPAGTSAEDLRSARALLRAACWAADVRIVPDESHSHLVTVDVIRRQPWPDDLTPVPGTGAAADACLS